MLPSFMVRKYPTISEYCFETVLTAAFALSNLGLSTASMFLAIHILLYAYQFSSLYTKYTTFLFLFFFHEKIID